MLFLLAFNRLNRGLSKFGLGHFQPLCAVSRDCERRDLVVGHRWTSRRSRSRETAHVGWICPSPNFDRSRFNRLQASRNNKAHRFNRLEYSSRVWTSVLWPKILTLEASCVKILDVVDQESSRSSGVFEHFASRFGSHYLFRHACLSGRTPSLSMVLS